MKTLSTSDRFKKAEIGDIFYPAIKNRPINCTPSAKLANRFVTKLDTRHYTASCTFVVGQGLTCFVDRPPLLGEAIKIDAVHEFCAHGQLFKF